jgi:hypothetical protein
MATLRDILDRNGLPPDALDDLEYGPDESPFRLQVERALTGRVPDVAGVIKEILASDDVDTCDGCGKRMGEDIEEMFPEDFPKESEEPDGRYCPWCHPEN